MSVETTGRFVDTNVLVYAHDRSAGTKHARARALLEELWDGRDGCLSVQVLQEFFVAVTRKVPRPLDTDRAREVVADLARWRVHEPGPEDVLGAIDIHKRAGLSFWDAMIVRSASRLSCVVIYSEDLSAGERYGGVLVANPFARD